MRPSSRSRATTRACSPQPGQVASALATVSARLDIEAFADAHLRHEARGEIDAALAQMASNVVFDVVNVPAGPLVGTEQVRAGYIAWTDAACCDSFTPVRRLHGEGFIAVEGIWQGRFSAPVFGPVRPGRTVRYRVLHVLELNDGQIGRETVWHDLAAIRRQLTATNPEEH